MTAPRRVKHADWLAEALRLFGAPLDVRFVCPVCKHVVTVRDYRDAGAPAGAIGFSCIGRYLDARPAQAFSDGDSPAGNGPCDYTSGGLLNLSPTLVIHEDGSETPVFDFDRGEVRS